MTFPASKSIRMYLMPILYLVLVHVGYTKASTCDIVPSVTPGFYESIVQVSFSVSGSCTLKYTIDSSSPLEQGIEYKGEILEIHPDSREAKLSYIDGVSHEGSPWREPRAKVGMASVIRTVLENKDGQIVQEKSFTYFIRDESSHTPGIPVVSLTFDEDLYFDHETGIYVTGKIYEEWRALNPDVEPDGDTPANYIQRGEEWEKPTYLEYFDEEGKLVVHQGIGIRIHGGWSRMYPQKSLRIYARNDYGKSTLDYPFFKDSDKVEFKRLILRNAGQEWDRTKLKDIYLTSLVRHFKAESQAYQPVIVYLNGEYWGLYNLRERIDQHYLELKYGIDRDQIDMINALGEAEEGDSTRYNSMYEFFKQNDFTSDELYTQALTKVDLNSFLEHFISQIFVGNSDWPDVNQDIWSKQTDGYVPDAPFGHDGKFYWIIADQDFGFISNQYEFNSLKYAMQEGGHRFGERSNLIFRKLLENETFKNEFIVRFYHHLNTTYDTDRMIEKLRLISRMIEPHIHKHYQRWAAYDLFSEKFRDVNDWKTLINEMDEFAQKRNGILNSHLRDYFDLSNEMISITLTSEDYSMGFIEINGLDLDYENPVTPMKSEIYTGVYPKQLNYQIQAVPKEGYVFLKWEGTLIDETNQYEPVLTLTGNENFQLIAVFSEEILEDNTAPNVIAPHVLSKEDYLFDSWSPDNPEYTYPPSMYFTQSTVNDPGIEDSVDVLYFIPEQEYAAADQAVIGFPYKTTSRTRIEGLGEDGIAFINTGRGRDLGAAVLSLDATDQTDIVVYWEASTLIPNFRTYNIRLQVKSSEASEWTDVLDENGDPVEYRRSDQAGHTQVFGPTILPDSLNNLPLIHLRWKYYYTGTRLEGDGGSRDKLRLDNIRVSTLNSTSTIEGELYPTSFTLLANYPNPFNNRTIISYSLPGTGHVKVEIYDLLGKMMHTLFDGIQESGLHHLPFNANQLSSGIYFYSIQYNNIRLTGKMSLVK